MITGVETAGEFLSQQPAYHSLTLLTRAHRPRTCNIPIDNIGVGTL